ncbi:hypothetical protein H5410_049612 [Solanum commersonii]|uniref:Uncharacterized protein n=1 Tax=Solanum commersonii TaxID=4109 RepID=A0A9J5WT32_SOLCO|nr:hypothetical protein H5410_049612 [Solanum commersonii]
MDVRYKLINGMILSRGANKRIFNFKQDPDFFFAEFSRGKQTHFQVQTSPKSGKNQIYHFLCAIVHEFLVIHESDIYDFINGVSWSQGENIRISSSNEPQSEKT